MSIGKNKFFITRTRGMRTVGGYIVAACLLIGGFASYLGTGKTATAAPSAQLNFQARLLTSSGAPVADGYYNIQFKLYTAATGGAAIWTEDWIDTNGVTAGNDFRVRVVDGYLSVYLGTLTAFPAADWGSQHYITMNVGGTTQTATPTFDGEMLNTNSERMQLTAVPYAFAAANVGSGDTNAASSDSSDVAITTGDALGATSNSGDILIDTGSATGTAGVINLGSTNASAINIGRSGITTTLQGNVSISGGTNYGVYYRDGSGNVVTTAAGSSNECFRANTGAAPTWGSCSGTGDVIQNGNSFTATMVIGTNDAYSLALETGGTTRLTIDTSGNATLTGDLTVQGGDITAGTTGTAGSLVISDGSSSTVTLKSATQVAATNYDLTIPAITANDTLCLQTLNNCAGTASGWTDGGTVVALTTSTDHVTVGSTNDLAKLSVDGQADEIQFLVQGNGTQTSDIFVVESSAGTDILSVDTGGVSITTPTTGSSVGLLIDATTNGNVGLRVLGPNAMSSGALIEAGQTGAGFYSFSVDYLGRTGFRPVSDGAGIFRVQNAGGTENLLDINSSTGLVSMSGSLSVGETVQADNFDIPTGGSVLSYTTPGAATVNTRIRIANQDPGAFGQLVALGVPSTAQATSRVLSLFDGRTVTHQPTLAVFSPDEADVIGFSWEGSNSTAYLKTQGDNIGLRINTTDIITMTSSAITLVQDATASGNFAVNGNTTLGNATSDTVTFTGRVASTVNPTTNDSFDLGSSSLIWNDVYVDRICFDGGADCATSTASFNTSGWTDGGTVVSLQTNTDDVTIGSSSNLGKLAIDGDSDEIQFLVQANATQTSNLVVFENSAGTDLFVVSSAGNVTMAGDLQVNGGDITTAAGDLTINPAGGDTNVTGNLDASGNIVAGSADNFTAGASGIDYFGNSSSALRVGYQSGIPLFGVDTLTGSGNNAVVYFGSSQSDVGTTQKDSSTIQLNGSYYNGSANTQTFSILNDITGVTASAYKLSILNTSSTEVLSLSGAGDLSVNGTGTSTFAGNLSVQGNTTIGNAVTDGLTVTSAIQGANALIFDGATDNGNEITLAITDPGADFTITLPAETGTICTTAAAGACSTAGSGYVQLAPSSAQTDSTANAAININKSGNANLATLDNTNASANGVSIDIQSSSASQYAFRATSNNGSTNGLVVLGSGHVGIGTASPTRPLQVDAAAPNIVDGAGIYVGSSLTSTSNDQSGIKSQPDVAPGSASTQFYSAVNFTTTSSSSNLTGAGMAGIYGGTYYSGTGTVGNSYGGLLQIQNVSTGTLSNAFGLLVSNPTNSGGGTITANYGLKVNDQTAGTADYGIAIAGADTQALWISSDADTTDAANGIGFGLSRDTNLYRSAANVLSTDDGLVVGLNAVVNGGTLAVANANASGVGVTGTNPQVSVSNAAFAYASGAAAYSNISSTNDAILRNTAGSLILSAQNGTGSIYFTTGATDTAKLTIANNGNITATNDVSIQGNTTLGNATSDTVTFTGRVASTVNPTTNDTYDLGSSSLIWNDVYVDRICFDGNTDCATTSAALNTSGFTDDGTVVRLTTSTDNVTIGNTGDLSAALAVDGNADEIQLLVQGNATQTSTNLVVFENSGGTDLFTVSGAGNTAIATTVADTSEAASLRVTSTATSITNEQNGIYSSLTASPASGTPARTYNAIEGQVQTSGATSANVNLWSIFGQATLTGSTANTGNIGGGNFYAQNQASVAAANMYGIMTSVQNISTGSITNAYGVNIQSNTAGSGTIGTNYGIFVNAQTAGTSDYGVAIQAADTQTLWISQNANNTSSAAGIAFGSSRDTVLYRSAANTVATGALSVGANAISGTTVALTANNGTSTGNIAEFQDGGTSVLTVADGGAVLLKNTTNSTAAFSIQNSSSQALLAADTSNTALNLFSGTAGDISPWTTDTAITDGNGGTTDTRDNATAVYYNGYVYMIGGDQGSSGLTSIYYTKVNPNGSLQTPWTNQTATGLTARTYASAVAVNGYIYLIGGSTNGTNGSLVVEYAKLSADGSIGTFTATTSLAAIRKEAYAVTYNGYIYVVGGNSSNTGSASAVNTVYYGKVNGDGTISSWTTNSNNLPASRREMQAAVANGYLYAFGGVDSAGARYDSVYYGKINSDGSVAAFSTQAGSIPGNNSGGGAGIAVMNGYVYLYGGSMTATDDEVAWAPLSATGGVGSWTNAAAADKMPAARQTFGHFAANGYMYAIGGWTGSTQTNTVYYTSAARLKVGGSLDLVGYGNGNLTEGSNGGMLTAGNTKIVGTLDVQDSSNFWRSVYMGSDLVVNGYLTHKNATNSTTAFQVQSASSTTPVFNIDTTNGRVGINTAAPTGDISFGGDTSRSINLIARSTNAAGSALSITAGAAGAGATGMAGGQLTLQGGAAAGTTGNANGGNVYLTGGAGVNSGAKGLVVIDTAAVTTTATDATCGATTSSSCTINVNTVNNTSAVTIGSTGSSIVISMPDPTITTAGRIFYFTATDNSNDFTLRLNAGGTQIDISMRENTTATLVWNGADWTAAGASSSTDLQAAYNNTLTSAGGAELVLNASGGAADGLTVRNNSTSPIFGGLLEVQTSIGSNLFTVNNNAAEYANNGGAETSTFTMWAAAPAGGSVSRYTTAGNNIATGSASVFADTTSTANTGIKNTLSTTLTQNLKYKVSYTVRHTSSTVAFNTLDTIYSSDGTSTTQTCASGSTATYNTWTRIDCTFTATAVGASNAIIIRHSDAVEHDFYVDNLSVTISADVNHAVDGSVDSALGTNWQAYDADGGAGTSTPTRDTSNIYDTSGAVAVATAGPAANLGVRNNMSITPSVSTQYLVTFYGKLASGTFTDITVGFLPAGGSGTPVSAQLCADYNTQTLSTSAWTKITCIFTTPSSGISDPDLVIYQPTSGARTFYIDALSITLNTNNSSNVQIGGGNKGGPTTLFTLDRSYGAPIADNNNAYLGSMYYDMSTGRIQCYEADGWGACGAAPDNYVNLNPEYSGAVLNGTGVGTMTADLCSNDSALSKNSTLCSTGQARNFYKWTSPQASDQTYSIYVTYQLPTTFNGFSSDDTIQLTARTDSTTNASVTYEMFKSTGSAVTQCGTGETTVVTSANTWQTVGINGNEATGCSFTSSSAGNFIIFKINMMAKNNANAYVSTLSFTTTGR